MYLKMELNFLEERVSDVVIRGVFRTQSMTGFYMIGKVSVIYYELSMSSQKQKGILQGSEFAYDFN